MPDAGIVDASVNEDGTIKDGQGGLAVTVSGLRRLPPGLSGVRPRASRRCHRQRDQLLRSGTSFDVRTDPLGRPRLLAGARCHVTVARNRRPLGQVGTGLRRRSTSTSIGTTRRKRTAKAPQRRRKRRCTLICAVRVLESARDRGSSQEARRRRAAVKAALRICGAPGGVPGAPPGRARDRRAVRPPGGEASESDARYEGWQLVRMGGVGRVEGPRDGRRARRHAGPLGRARRGRLRHEVDPGRSRPRRGVRGTRPRGRRSRAWSRQRSEARRRHPRRHAPQSERVGFRAGDDGDARATRNRERTSPSAEARPRTAIGRRFGRRGPSRCSRARCRSRADLPRYRVPSAAARPRRRGDGGDARDPVGDGLRRARRPLAGERLLRAARCPRSRTCCSARRALLVVGPEGSVSTVVAAAVLPLAVAGSANAVELASMLALLVGACFLLARLLRLGWLADYFSRPVLIGYIHGVAVVLVIGQIGKLLGLSISARDPLDRLAENARELGDGERRDGGGRRRGAGACCSRSASSSRASPARWSSSSARSASPGRSTWQATASRSSA